MNIEELELEFQERHLPLLGANFRSTIYTQLDAVENLLKGLEHLSDVQMPDKFFNKIIGSSEVLEPLLTLADDNELEFQIEQLPNSFILPLEERHRSITKGDSLLVIISKAIKKLSYSLGNKRQTRTIEYRYLVGSAFVEHQYLCLKWNKTLLGLVNNFMVQAKVEALNIYSENVQEPALTDLISTYQVLVKDFRQKAEMQIQQQLSSYKDRILKDLGLAGTREMSGSLHRKDLLTRRLNTFKSDLKESAKTWGDLISINIEQIKAASTLIKLNQQLNTYEDNLRERFEVYISNQIRSPLTQLTTFLGGHLNTLEKNPTVSKQQLESFCDEITERTHNIITEDLVDPLTATCDDRILSKKLDSFASEVSLLANRVEDSVTLVEELEFHEQLPEYMLKPIQWQSLFRRILGDEYLSELLAEDIKPEKQLELIVEDFSEVNQIISTNLSIAQDVEKSETEEPFEIVKKGIELAILKLEDISREYPKIEQFLEAELGKHQQELSDRIVRLLIDQNSDQIRREDAKIIVRQSALDVKNRLIVLWAKFMDRLELARRFVVSKIKSVITTIRSFLGLTETEHINVQKTNIAAILHEIDQKYHQLPYIYRRLFDFKRPAESTFFVKNNSHFENVSKAYELWKSDFPSSIAILGEKGSGRTTLLNYLNSEIFINEKVEFIHFDRTIYTESELLDELSTQLKVSSKKTAEEFVSLILRRRKKSVIIIENVQNCFLRTVQGYEAINTLLYLISETKDKILWVCSCSQYAWDFLNVSLRIGDYFSHTLYADSQSSGNISEIIMRRQTASGYQLVVQPDAGIQNSRAYKKLADDVKKQEKYLLEVFFERLNKMAEGNATVALIYWIRCIQRIDSAEVYLKLEENTGIEYLSELDSETLFVFSAFVIHDVLNAKQLGEYLNISSKNAETIISRLISRGLLVELNHGFGLNDLIYRQVVRLLKSRNFINA